MNKQELIGALNDLAPKNPKGEWGKMQRDIVNEAIDMLNRAVVIPKDAINGDVIKAMFPNFMCEDSTEYFHILRNPNGDFLKTNKAWWDEPYKKGE